MIERRRPHMQLSEDIQHDDPEVYQPDELMTLLITIHRKMSERKEIDPSQKALVIENLEKDIYNISQEKNRICYYDQSSYMEQSEGLTVRNIMSFFCRQLNATTSDTHKRIARQLEPAYQARQAQKYDKLLFRLGDLINRYYQLFRENDKGVDNFFRALASAVSEILINVLQERRYYKEE